jgi:hypothetical protein
MRQSSNRGPIGPFTSSHPVRILPLAVVVGSGQGNRAGRTGTDVDEVERMIIEARELRATVALLRLLVLEHRLNKTGEIEDFGPEGIELAS